jgi:hypothetical protein
MLLKALSLLFDISGDPDVGKPPFSASDADFGGNAGQVFSALLLVFAIVMIALAVALQLQPVSR